MSMDDISVVDGKHVFFRSLKPWKYALTRDYACKVPVYPPKKVCLPDPPHDPFITLDVDGTLVIKKGYYSDASSGPTHDDPSNMRGAFVHDALYQLMRDKKIVPDWKKAADKVLHDFCIEDGMSGWRADLWLWAVDKFGKSSAAPTEKDPMLEEQSAP